jgi:hypothetical protein
MLQLCTAHGCLQVDAGATAAAAAVPDAGRESLLSSFVPQEVVQLLIAAADLDIELPLLPQLAVLLQV